MYLLLVHYIVQGTRAIGGGHQIRELFIGGLSRKYLSILNISRTCRVTLIQLDRQLEETLLCIHEQSISHGASHSAVRRR